MSNTCIKNGFTFGQKRTSPKLTLFSHRKNFTQLMQSLLPHFWPNVGFRAIPTQKCRGINGHHRLGDDGDNSQPITICSTNRPTNQPSAARASSSADA